MIELPKFEKKEREYPKVCIFKERVPNLKIFFTKKELKDLGLRISVSRYKRFIEAVNRRIFIDIILRDKEGFLLPYKMGQLSMTKIKRVGGARLKYLAMTDWENREYNAHTFGNIYHVNWNRNTFSHFRSRLENVNTFPHYNGVPLLYYKLYDFKCLGKNKKLINYQIGNNTFNHF